MSSPDDPKPAQVVSGKKGKKGRKGKKGKKRRKGGDGSGEEEGESVRLLRPKVNVSHGELPDGALLSDGGEEEEGELDEVSKALNQNLDM